LSESYNLYSFSWKNHEIHYEKLEDHLILTYDFFKKIFEKRVSKILTARLRYNTCEEFTFLIRLAPLMHDIGKAHPYYQKTARDGEPYFSWHEVFSAQICSSIIESFRFMSEVNTEIFEEMKNIVTAAIISHHQALREIERVLPPRRIKMINLDAWNFNSLSCILSKLLETAMDKLSLKRIHTSIIDSSLNDFKEEIKAKRNNLELIRNSLFEQLRSPRLKLHSVITGPLVICDWLAAGKLRGPKYEHQMLKEATYSFPEIKNYI